MSQKPAAPAKAMMDEVERLRTTNGGTYPVPRAVRATMKGSQERADHAILAVRIANGSKTHLRHTLPGEFQAELPAVSEAGTLPASALTDLPPEARELASDFFSVLGTLYRTQVEALTGRAKDAEKQYQEETTELHERLRDAMRALDGQERAAEAAMQVLRDASTGLRVQVSSLAEKVAAKDRELMVQREKCDALVRQAQEVAATDDRRAMQRITVLEEELKMERERCRTAEQLSARLTATNEAIRSGASLPNTAPASEATPGDGAGSGKAARPRAVSPRTKKHATTETVGVGA